MTLSEKNKLFGTPSKGGNNIIDLRPELPFKWVYKDGAGKIINSNYSIMINKNAKYNFINACNAVWNLATRLSPANPMTYIEKNNWNVTAGCFVYRYIANTTTLSNHSWGTAIDIDSVHNPWKNPLTTTFSKDFVNCWKSNGFGWSGDYKNTKSDPMHFEIEDVQGKIKVELVKSQSSAELKAIEAKVDKLISKFGFTDRQGWIDKLAGKKQVSTSELNAFVDKVIK